MIDSTRLGQLTARVMDDVQDLVDEGALPPDAVVRDALVVVELAFTDEDGDDQSLVTARATDDRNVIGLGLAQRATQAMLDPD